MRFDHNRADDCAVELSPGWVAPMTDLPVASLELPSLPTSSRLARRFVAERLHSWGAEAAIDDATLLVSELVTNAVVHARTTVDLVVRHSRGTIRVEVLDRGNGIAQPAFPGPDDVSGRGLGLVQAVAPRWGVEDTPGGKVVWFELSAE